MALIANLKLMQKLLTAPAVVLLFLLVSAVVSIIGVNVQQSSVNEIFNERYTASVRLGSINRSCVSVQGNIYKLISWARANYDASRIDALGNEQAKAMDQVIADLSKMESEAKTDEAKAKITAVLVQMKDYKKAAGNVIDFASIDLNTATFGMETAQDKYKLLSQSLDELSSHDYQLSQASYDDSTKNYYRVITILSLVAIAAIVCSILLSLYISRLITKPVLALESAAEKIAAGDTSITVDVQSTDEIGSLTASFNTMVGTIRSSEQALKR
jgi:methyl-accepting chemotaxis protein